jgi:hypothetical protein
LNSRNVVRRQLLQHMKRFMRLRMDGYGSIKQQNNPQMQLLRGLLRIYDYEPGDHRFTEIRENV